MKKIGEKLKTYFKDTGVQKKWLADRIGMDEHYLYQIVAGRRSVPQSYWKPLIQMTHNKITLMDLVEDLITAPEDIRAEPIDDKNVCQLSLT